MPGGETLRAAPVLLLSILILAWAPPSVAESSTERWSMHDEGVLFAGHGLSQYVQVDQRLKVGEREHRIASSKLYSVPVPYAVPFDSQDRGQIEVYLSYDARMVDPERCRKLADLDLFLYDSNGRLVAEATDDAWPARALPWVAQGCDEGDVVLRTSLVRPDTYELEVRANYGLVTGYALDIVVTS